MTELRDMTESELRDYKQGFPNSESELIETIRALVDRKYDYGTYVYAMSIAAEAAFNYVSHALGVTGFQASCAGRDFLRRSRGMESGFQIIDYDKLLYPQYADKFDLSFDGLIRKNAEHLSKRARKLLAERPDAHPDVLAHWDYVASLVSEQ